MERLTMRKGKAICCSAFEKGECHFEYCEQCDHEAEAWSKLTEYEDLEEQGLLLRLPCKVGDTIYLVDFEEKIFDEATVNSIEIDTRDNRVLINSDYEVGTWSEDNYVFCSKEEAEQALAEMEKEK